MFVWIGRNEESVNWVVFIEIKVLVDRVVERRIWSMRRIDG